MTTPPADDRSARQDQRRYRALSAAAVVSLICGVLSAITIFDWLLGFIPAVGILTGWVALRRIRRAPEELAGRAIAGGGIALSVAFWIFGYGGLVFARVKEVPHGYQRINYRMLQPDPQVPGERVPPKILALDKKKVFVKGYMSPGRRQTGLKRFILCPSIAGCPFCTPDPKPTEMVRVELQGDLTARFTTHSVGVGGRLHVQLRSSSGVPYLIEADHLK